MSWFEDYTVVCPPCKQAVLSGLGAPAREHCSSVKHQVSVYHCDSCGSFWEVNAREAHPISAEQAAQYCSDADE